MNETNLILIVSLFSIGLALIIGYALGFRKGVSNQREESERVATKIASRHKRELALDY